jgi:PPOX class probable F420-dependent enzyme
MPTLPFPDDVRELLEAPNPAVVATLRSDGQPVTVATWYLLAGDQVLINMDEGRRRLDHLRADPRISLTVLAGNDWYTHVSLLGRVVSLYDDKGLVDIDRLSQHYRGRDYTNRHRGRVSALVEIDRWHAWGKLPRT